MQLACCYREANKPQERCCSPETTVISALVDGLTDRDIADLEQFGLRIPEIEFNLVDNRFDLQRVSRKILYPNSSN